MKHTVKKLSDTKVSLTITVTPEELERAEQAALGSLSKNVNAPGFRKGKTPPSVAAKHIGVDALGQETLQNAISRSMAEAYQAADLQPLMQPQVEVKKFVPKQELEFTAEVEVLPEIKLGDYKKLTSKAKPAKVSDKDVDDVVERLRDSLAETKEVKRAAKDGDDVSIDFVGKRDGTAFDGGTAKSYSLRLGSGQFIPGFEEGLIGHKAGEELTVPLKFPADYHVKDLQSAAVEFEVTIHSVSERSLPEVNDEFAAKVGPFTSADELRADIKRELTGQKEQEAVNVLKDELVKELVDKSTITAPEVLVEDQAKSIEQDFQQNLTQQGITLDSYLETNKFKSEDDWRKKEVHPAAERRVKSGLVLSDLAKKENIEATNEEIEQHVELYRQRYASSPGAAKQLEQPEVRTDIINRLLTEKTVDRLVELNSK